MTNYNIIKISEVDNDQLLDFYKKAFYHRHKILSKHWKWIYRNKYLGFETLVLIKDQKVVGQAGLIPTKIQINKEILPATWFVDFAVLPEYQRKGYGTALTEEWMKISPNQITFCNNKSLKIFRSLGWSSNNKSKSIVKPLDPINFIYFFRNFKNNYFSRFYKKILRKKLNNIGLIKPYSIKNNYKDLFESFKKRKNNFLNTVLRDEDWLNWRIMECPFRKNIHFFEYKGSFAIVHISINKKIKRLNILYCYNLYDLNGLNEEILIKLIYKWALDNSVDLIWANSNIKDMIKKYENIFTNRFTKNLNFASWSLNKKAHSELSDLQAVDSDNDTCLINDSNL